MLHRGGGTSRGKAKKEDGKGVIPCPVQKEEEEEQENAEHEREILSAVRTILDRAELLDVTFVCEDGQEVRASRTLLASASEYFSKLLYGDMKERSMDRIPFPTAKAGGLQIVISYVHGHPFTRWNTDSSACCWDDLVEAHCLAAQYQVDHLSQRISRLVRRVGNASELGEVLNAAIPRGAEEVQKAAVKVMNRVFWGPFDSSSFRGWSKESIICCLEIVTFFPNVTETMVAELVLSAATPGSNHHSGYHNHVVIEQENGRIATLNTSDDMLVADPAVDTSRGTMIASDAQRDLPMGYATEEAGRSPGLSLAVPEAGCSSLSRDDLAEILQCHVNLAFVDPSFVKEKIEPLKILRPEVLAAVYGVQAIFFSRGLSTKSVLAIPWHSLSPRVSFAPVKPGGEGVHRNYIEVAIPTVWTWSESDSSHFKVVKGLPQHVQCTCQGDWKIATMKVPLLSGKHIWMVRSPEFCEGLGVGVVTSTALPMRFFCCPGEKTYYSHNFVVRSSERTRTLRPLMQKFLSVSGIETFGTCHGGAAVFVILDMDKRSLTFAAKLELYHSHKGEYPELFRDLPSGTPLHPAVLMTKPGSAEIEWIQSSLGPRFVHPN
ncbi:hypothetical protein CBR_g20233 [Chara braunii]|uniref:BTB domain-containing protein n=1 Tax=Chara braunii TaxID=69332 RepID=A0A388L038_CHABU|nr:hypothetical protein CBR_g20233 [Chara braunii]|eukprot:GBG75602.1 hypothetical protein CBR_g20233 [Chara braunii]